MSGGSFSADWLELREPLDHASVNAEIRKCLVDHFASQSQLSIVDLGAGTGSNLRGLSPWLPQEQSWRLLDYDQTLLDVAATSIVNAAGSQAVTTRCVDLKSGDLGELFAGADLISSSAFFDIASRAIVERVVTATANARAVFYTVLTYDGLAAWFPEHPADPDMRRLFNAHQQTDKGMGPALGPTATEALAKAFEAVGYRVLRGRSPWVTDRRYSALRGELDRGWAGAVREVGQLEATTIADWLDAREASNEAVTIVGHEDLLALPPR